LYKRAQESIEVRTEFLSIASHELKTPITSLQMQLEMALRKIKASPASFAPEKMAKTLELSNKQVKKLTSLLEDMLDISRIEAGKLVLVPEKVDFSELVQEVCERLQEQFEAKGCIPTTHLSKELVGYWDKNRIEQVIVNLLMNALKYAPQAPIEISSKRFGNSMQLAIKDYGPGIPDEKHFSIFERFERANPSRSISGLGLGLFIARQIVQAHRGKLWVESSLGQGAKFIVELPLIPN
jgi:signal transduction histidine kinase